MKNNILFDLSGTLDKYATYCEEKLGDGYAVEVEADFTLDGQDLYQDGLGFLNIWHHDTGLNFRIFLTYGGIGDAYCLGLSDIEWVCLVAAITKVALGRSLADSEDQKFIIVPPEIFSGLDGGLFGYYREMDTAFDAYKNTDVFLDQVKVICEQGLIPPELLVYANNEGYEEEEEAPVTEPFNLKPYIPFFSPDVKIETESSLSAKAERMLDKINTQIFQ